MYKECIVMVKIFNVKFLASAKLVLKAKIDAFNFVETILNQLPF